MDSKQSKKYDPHIIENGFCVPKSLCDQLRNVAALNWRNWIIGTAFSIVVGDENEHNFMGTLNDEAGTTEALVRAIVKGARHCDRQRKKQLDQAKERQAKARERAAAKAAATAAECHAK